MVKTDFFQEVLQYRKRDLSIELGSVSSTARSIEDLYPRSRLSRLAEGKLLRGDITGGEILNKQT